MQKVGFTMSEILLSLTIIGVVAAITLPSLTGNINEKVWNTQRKALYARMSQAISLMPALNGYGIGANDAETNSNAAQAFITQGLSKVLKINNVCDSEHLADCGVPKQLTTFDNIKKNFPRDLTSLNSKLTSISHPTENYHNRSMLINTQAAAFETQNGESVVVYYNPYCRNANQENSLSSHIWHYTQYSMCANFIYDLNGKKGPNKVGKDIGFISALYPVDSVVATVVPVGVIQNSTVWKDINKECLALNPDAKMLNYDEGAVFFYNLYLINTLYKNSAFWTSTSVSPEKAWVISNQIGYREHYSKSKSFRTFCIKR